MENLDQIKSLMKLGTTFKDMPGKMQDENVNFSFIIESDK